MAELTEKEIIEQGDPLELSDEAFMELSEPPEVIEEEGIDEEIPPLEEEEEIADPPTELEDEDPEPEPEEEEEEEPTSALEVKDGEEELPEDPEPEDLNKKKEDEKGAEEIVEPEEKPKDKDKEESESAETEDPDEDSETPDADKDPIDYKAEYEKMIAPFKANGKTMSVQSPDDVIRLKQMGANYHKKMAGLKPSLRILKLLEQNNLMDEDNLNFVIDLHNKNPEAITKLLKDSGMDPLDVNVKDDSTYVPTKHTVSDSALALDAVLEDIQDTPTFDDTLNLITKVWDPASRQALAETPTLISTLNSQMEDGTYKIVSDAVAYERNMGRLVGIPDLQAYKMMGDKLHAEGKLAPAESKTPETPAPAAKEPAAQKKPAVPPVQKDPKAEAKRLQRKKAASPTKNMGTPAAVSYDPLAMSDEAFEKIDPNDFKTQ